MVQVSAKTYSDVHLWLNKKFGKAIACENPECEGKTNRFGYALKAGKTHKKLRANYMTLCNTCHSAYDTKHKNRGHISNPRNRLSMRFLWECLAKFEATKQEKKSVADFLNFVESSMKSHK